MSLPGDVAAALSLSLEYVVGLASRADSQYRQFTLPKANGKRRVIHHPSRSLKALQRWLVVRYISDLPVHEAAKAYRHRLSIADNARIHAPFSYTVRLDIKRFFESISESDIAALLRTSSMAAQWSQDDFAFFLESVCYMGRLTIGAPSSPSLANAIFFPLDVKIAQLAEDNGLIYTRYADDLYFSSNVKMDLGWIEKAVSQVLADAVFPSGLQLNLAKSRKLSKKHRKIVTGLVITPQGTLSVGHSLKRRVRSLVYKVNTLTPSERKYLAGVLAYIRSVEPDFVNRLFLKYGTLTVSTALHPTADAVSGGNEFPLQGSLKGVVPQLPPSEEALRLNRG